MVHDAKSVFTMQRGQKPIQAKENVSIEAIVTVAREPAQNTVRKEDASLLSRVVSGEEQKILTPKAEVMEFVSSLRFAQLLASDLSRSDE